MHAWGLRLRGVLGLLAIAHPSVWPSAMLNDVGTPVAIISQLNARPACAPVNASMAALQLSTHDSGPGRSAKPFLYDSFIHYCTPVYPGARQRPAIPYADFALELIRQSPTNSGISIQATFPRASFAVPFLLVSRFAGEWALTNTTWQQGQTGIAAAGLHHISETRIFLGIRAGHSNRICEEILGASCTHQRARGYWHILSVPLTASLALGGAWGFIRIGLQRKV